MTIFKRRKNEKWGIAELPSGKEIEVTLQISGNTPTVRITAEGTILYSVTLASRMSFSDSFSLLKFRTPKKREFKFVFKPEINLNVFKL